MKWVVALFVLPSLVSAVLMALIFGPMVVRHWTDARLRSSGLPAIATVLAIQDTGSRVNMEPVANVTLQVSPPSGAAFQSSAQIVMTAVNSSLLQPGRQVQVRYSPQSLAQVVIVAAAGP